MNPCHTSRLYCSSLKNLGELGNSQNKLHILVGKGSLPNRKSTSQKEVNNKIRIACSDLYHKSFPNVDSPEKIYPNIYKHLWNVLVKFQLDPTVRFEVMLNSVNLNGRNVYAKIWIWPCLGRITRLNRINLVITWSRNPQSRLRSDPRKSK